MKTIHRKTLGLGLAALFIAFLNPSTAWGQGSNGQSPKPQQQPPQNQNKPGQPAGTFTPDDPNAKPPAPAATVEEDTAYKAVMEKKSNDVSDVPRRIQLGEDFIKKYPQSRYLPSVYSAMTLNYLIVGQTPKMLEFGEKALQVNPADVLVLALLGQTIPRAWNAASADAQQQLDRAQRYSNQVIELTPTLVKPEGQSEEDFAMANKQRLAMAHSGLGLVYFRRGKYAEAVPELEESTKLISEPDPVNYYLLGMALEKTSHFDGAAAAFTKCSEIDGPLQTGCKEGIAQAKKLAGTQLSAPK
jgi:tetratricopeptide (TPR) repeat protein